MVIPYSTNSTIDDNSIDLASSLFVVVVVAIKRPIIILLRESIYLLLALCILHVFRFRLLQSFSTVVISSDQHIIGYRTNVVFHYYGRESSTVLVVPNDRFLVYLMLLIGGIGTSTPIK